MDKEKLRRGVKRLLLTLLLMLSAPLIIASAFKNEGHPLYFWVLGLGIVLGAGAIYSGFTGIRMLTRALLGDR